MPQKINKIPIKIIAFEQILSTKLWLLRILNSKITVLNMILYKKFINITSPNEKEVN